LDPDALLATDVRTAVRTVLDGPDYTAAVGYVRDEFRKLPPVSAVVRRLEQLAEES
jgi:N-glycosyltransferase